MKKTNTPTPPLNNNFSRIIRPPYSEENKTSTDLNNKDPISSLSHRVGMIVTEFMNSSECEDKESIALPNINKSDDTSTETKDNDILGNENTTFGI